MELPQRIAAVFLQRKRPEFRFGIRALGLGAVFGLAACTPAAQDQIAREAARSAITPVVAERFPGVPLEPALDCIIDNANATQIRALAADAVLGPTASTVEIVSQIVTKPETVTCLTRQGLPALLSGNL